MNNSLFGLPEKIKVCQKCTYTNQKPNSTIEFRSKKLEIKKQVFYLMGNFVVHVLTQKLKIMK